MHFCEWGGKEDKNGGGSAETNLPGSCCKLRFPIDLARVTFFDSIHNDFSSVHFSKMFPKLNMLRCSNLACTNSNGSVM